MASHVVVIDATARRHTIKTTPNKHLSDVLQEACAKFGLNPDQYGLKHNNKPVDLSRTLRLSGLTSGAKLDLVQASRSPSVVSVALQLPDSAASGTGAAAGPARLTDKFPSDTPIWQILRRFEAGVAGSGPDKPNYNFTQRATPQMSNSGESGAGRLCYEMPVVNFMGRELSSFLELQKTLGQLGFNSGTCLLRLNYRKTERPLEEAMTEISQYFKAVEEPPSTGTNTSGAHGAGPGNLQSKPDSDSTTALNGIAGEPTSPLDTPMESAPSQDIPATSAPQGPLFETILDSDPASRNITPTETSSSHTGISIFAPPSSTTPLAASQTAYDEADYVPTIDHAKLHQARLATSSYNKRLPSDAELSAQQQARSAALSEITSVVVRIRFPDQSQAQRTFAQDATIDGLYDMCRELMARPNDEAFVLRAATGVRTGTSMLAPSGKRLIGDLGWQGRVLVTVAWGDDVAAEVRKGASLKEEYRAKAEDLKVEMPKEPVEEDAGAGAAAAAVEQEGSKGKGKAGPEKEAKMMRFLKGLSKK